MLSTAGLLDGPPNPFGYVQVPPKWQKRLRWLLTGSRRHAAGPITPNDGLPLPDCDAMQHIRTPKFPTVKGTTGTFHDVTRLRDFRHSTPSA